MGIKERREREKIQRQSDILDAAEKVFFEKGYNAAKMDDVAQEAEFSKGTLYLYFKSKEELYFGLTHRALLNLRSRFQHVIEGDGTGLEKVVKIGLAFRKYSQEEPEYYKTIAQFEMAQLGAAEESDQVAAKCHKAGQGVLELVAAAIVLGKNDGTIRQDADPLKTAFLLQGLSNGVIQLMARESKHIQKFEAFQPDELMEDFTTMMIRALQSD